MASNMDVDPQEKTNERDLTVVPDELNFGYIESYVKQLSKASGESHMDKGYKYYSERFIHNITVQKTAEGCKIKGRCYKSMKKSEEPHSMCVAVYLEDKKLHIKDGSCTCAKGLGESCGHLVGLLYQFAHYKKEARKAIPADIAKTSLPQTWHKPRGDVIKGGVIQDLTLVGYNKNKKKHTRDDQEEKAIKSTLYNPLREMPIFDQMLEKFSHSEPDMMIIPALTSSLEQNQLVDTKFGKFPQGSVIAVQQKLHSDYVLNILDGFEFPSLPVRDVIVQNYNYVLSYDQFITIKGLYLTKAEIADFEKQTRLQSESNLWHKLRSKRITASKVHDVFVRRRNFETLSLRLKSTSFKTTQAIREGMLNEPVAAGAYSVHMNNAMNIYPCGIVISPTSPWLAVSPDRKVYTTSRIPSVGLLEIKCPSVKESVKDKDYLVEQGGSYKLKTSHRYYTQIQMQLAITGLLWCDFYVWSTKDDHTETIWFDPVFWEKVKDKVDSFYFDYFI